jgi:hypothetical protein
MTHEPLSGSSWSDAYIEQIAREAARYGLDGHDLGRLRDFIWWHCTFSDAIDHSIIERVGQHLQARGRAQPPVQQTH